VTVDLDATLVGAHTEKEQAAPTFKRVSVVAEDGAFRRVLTKSGLLPSKLTCGSRHQTRGDLKGGAAPR
jgi:hypothetical protein